MRDWRCELNLEPHGEGGYFRRVYTSPHDLSTPHGPRPSATSIYYLLDERQPSGLLHRNRSDILHFLIDGGPLEYVTVTADGTLRRTVLGPDDERFLLVPGGHWKASHLLGDARHGLVAEVVTPGFDYTDHEFATRAVLDEYPDLAEELREFVRD
ncbi:cupin domain-containing protein [Streptomyces sp. NBC_00006]|uniref:cupin domain-containing protein n=1 Tax=unclassified Streptomyces TaxID=2593676 RepID=UPI0022529A8A|nr:MULTISPECIES: cupin domain-containing protein [unclassified Streptomyces]MCX4835700.1 cupin domain-containing protein [Streptomyces sp. NBC_01016]MCX5537099.1 cupin domain-containing protein [Streptomyces sp. NBC_00006]